MVQQRLLNFTVLILALLCGSAQAYLHSAQGRFLQRDPLGFADGMGLYEYVRSTPLARLDWTGHQAAALPAISGPAGLMTAVATAYAKYKAVFVLTTVTAAAIASAESGLFETKLALQNLGLEDTAIKEWARDAQRALDELAQKLAAEEKPKPIPVPKCDDKKEEQKPKRCKPCVPPAGTTAISRTDTQGAAHGGIPTPHSHLLQVNQSPYPECKCFWNTAQPDCVPGIPPLPLVTPVMGGGPE